jgi:vitamin B12 transporter
MKNSFRARGFAPALSILSLAVAVSLHAQTIELDPVVVSATRIEQKLSDVTPSASVITREEIERSQAPTLVDLIQGQPGIEIGRNGGPGTVSSIFMRGQSSNNVAVFVDGVPVQRDAYGVLKLVDIPPSQIEKVEILRGNMGAVYGESAVGGVIHIYTLAGYGRSGTTASIGFGSRNTADVGTGYQVQGADYVLGAALQRLSTDGYSAMNPSQNVGVNPDLDGYTRESVFLNGQKTINADVTLGFQANAVEGRVDYDSAFDSASDVHQSEQRSSDLTVDVKFKVSSAWTSRLALTTSRFENQELKNRLSNGLFEGDQLSSQWSNTYQLGTGSANFGVDVADADFENYGKHQRRTNAAYAGYNGRVGTLDYQANARHDRITSESDSQRIKNQQSTWLMAAGYQLSEAWKVTAMYSTSFRAPHTGELFGFYGNPDLQPQEHEGSEFGLQYQTTAGLFRAVYFDTDTQNDFGYGADFKPYNIAQTENSGVELSITGALDDLGYKLSLVSQDPKNALTQERLHRRAKSYGSLALSQAAMGVNWGADLIWSGDRTDVGQQRMDAYTVVNLSASKAINPTWTARVKLENAFDEAYQFAHGYDAVPRGVFFTLQYQPK